MTSSLALIWAVARGKPRVRADRPVEAIEC
jgi:hypothetical protein